MPYTRDEAQSFTKKATTDARRRQWEHVFQYYFKSGCTELQSIRAANAAVGRNFGSSQVSGAQSCISRT
jgi:hypothetical protein